MRLELRPLQRQRLAPTALLRQYQTMIVPDNASQVYVQSENSLQFVMLHIHIYMYFLHTEAYSKKKKKQKSYFPSVISDI